MQKKNDVADENRNLILKLNQSNLSIARFCLENNLDESIVKKTLSALKYINDPLYDEYKIIANDRKEHLFVYIHGKLKNMANDILFGIDENGAKRDFDIIDYYTNVSINFDDLAYFIQKMNFTKEEFLTLNNFLIENKNLKVVNKSSIISMSVKIGIKKDKNGKVIPKTGRFISEIEKLEVIEWLIKNKVPLANKTYFCALNRHINGKLFESITNHKL